MKRSILLSTVAALAFLPHSAFAADGGASPIRSVTLSSGGLAEIGRVAHIDGNGSIAIDVPLDQVDDVLKSIVVFDGQGSVRDISLAGPHPLDETFKNMPFTPDDLASLPKLLAALKGAAVTVEGQNRGSGTILGVDRTAEAQGAQKVYLNLLTPQGGIRRFEIDGSTSVDFDDQALRAKIAAASGNVGANISDASREVVVKMDGTGKRDVDFSYVIAAPVWKTAYRVVIGDKGKARLQAWGVLENATGEDWKDVSLTLSSSSPVTLTQRLHELYWKHRDELPVMADEVGIPRADRGAMDSAVAQGASTMPTRNALRVPAAPMMAMAEAAPAPAMAKAQMSFAQSATPTESDISATFRLDGTYDVKSGDTVSVPIVDTQADAEKVSLFRQDAGSDHPVSAVSLKNGSGVSLPGGILTVYDTDGSYVGDASLLGLPAGETRMVSFALDRKVSVTSDQQDEQATVAVKAHDGLLETKTVYRQEFVYTVKGAADAPRTVLIEQPKMPGWTFRSDVLSGESATDYRLRFATAAGETKTVKGTFEREGGESYRIADVDEATIAQWDSASIDPKVKAKLAELAAAKADEADTQNQLQAASSAHDALTQAQNRTRENLKAMPAGSDGQRQYAVKLSDLETQLTANEKKQEDLRAKLEGFSAKVTEVVRTF